MFTRVVHILIVYFATDFFGTAFFPFPWPLLYVFFLFELRLS